MLSLIRIIENLMTGKYAVFWQVIGACLTLFFLWWFYESGNLSSFLDMMVSIIKLWLSLFGEVPEILAEGNGFFGTVFSVGFAGFYVLLLIAVPIWLSFWAFLFIVRPIATMSLIWENVHEPMLWLLKIIAFFLLIGGVGALANLLGFTVETGIWLSVVIFGLAILNQLSSGWLIEKVAHFIVKVSAKIRR
ncbi:hypothetical protein HIMB100_00006160 [SAR116 cluster alpha proteobacterium HIMB100]|nr:hypothetical protein HIMB100_00006160 [SAR116 cluster alpha proteobacterium HIMB100]